MDQRVYLAYLKQQQKPLILKGAYLSFPVFSQNKQKATATNLQFQK